MCLRCKCKCKDPVSAVNACFVGIGEAREISLHGTAADAGEDNSNWHNQCIQHCV